MAEKTKKSKSVVYYLNDLRKGFVDFAHETGIDAGGTIKTFSVFALKGYLGNLEKDAKLCFGNDDIRGEWADLFETKNADDGETIKLRFKVEFTVATLSRGLDFGFSKAADPKGSTSYLVHEMYGATIKNFLLTGERKIFYPKAEMIAETLLYGIFHIIKKPINDGDRDDWFRFLEKHGKNFRYSLGAVNNDIARSRSRWCVTIPEYFVGMFDILRDRTEGILWLLKTKNPDLWDEAMTKLTELRKSRLSFVTDGGYSGRMLTSDLERIARLKSLILKKANEGHLTLYVGRAGVGKAMPKDTLIPTPDGEKLLGDIKVGDFVFDRKGHPTKVLEVYDRGVRRCFELTFSDGRKTRCCDEHIWSCYTSRKNLKNFTLQEMMEKGIRKSAKSGGRFRMPINGCVEFAEKELPVHPYILGVFLGDGCCTERYLTLSSNDRPVVEKVAKLLNATAKKQSENNYSWLFMKGGKAITTKEVFGDIASWVMRGSNDKAIPADYLHGSREQRIALLQGLFDTDGSVSCKSNGLASFFTTSSELYAGVSYLLRSLGLPTSTSSKPVCRGRVKQDGTCSTDYVVKTYLKPDQFDVCFSLPRQIEKLKSVFGTFNRPSKCTERVALTDVREIEPCEQVCILVDNPEHLFLANDFLVTHNTENALKRVKDVSGERERWTFVSLSNSVCSMGATRAQKKCHMSISPSSIARCRVCKSNPNIIEDEFSQWGMAELELFLNLLEDSKEMIIMGDDRQIPSFLGRGCLLHDVRELLEKECSRAVIHLKEVKRADSPELINSVLAFSETANINSLSQWFCRENPEDVVRDWGRRLTKNGIIISGANKNVDMLNWRMFAYWLRKFLDDEVLDDGERQILLDAISAIKKNGDPDEKDEVTMDYDVRHQGLATPQVVAALKCVFSHYDDTLPVLMRKAEDLCSYDDINNPKKHCVFCYGHATDEKNMNFKRFLMSERAEIVNIVDNGYLMRNDRGGELHLSFDKVERSVVPGFSITVNKAQGLEWDDVLIYIPRIAKSNYNLVSANAFYVAASRARSSLKIIPSNEAWDGIRPFESFTNAFDITLANA